MKITPTHLPLLCPAPSRNDTHAPHSVLKLLGFGDIVDNRCVDHIRSAEHALQELGYTFIGYHGTNRAHLRSMCETGLNPAFCGTGDGQARGSGFYVARSAVKALDYADASTQAGDPQPPDYASIPRHTGDQGIQELTRVYARHFQLFQPGRDLAWGLESSDGDPNADKRLVPQDCGAKLFENMDNLEMVVSPARYQSLAVLPSLHQVNAESLLSEIHTWPTHEY